MAALDKTVRIYDWFARYDLAKTVIAAKWPAGFAMLTAGTGIAEHQPYMWIFMATALVFMGSVVGFVYANSWRERNSPQNKLRYVGTAVNYDLVAMNRTQNRANKKVNLERTLDKTQIGVMLRNDSHFSISVILHAAKTAMEDHKPPRSDFPKEATVLHPGNVMYLMDEPIPMNSLPCQKLEGKMDITVKYGLPGKELYQLDFKGKVEAMMQPVGFITQIYTHWESEQIRA